MAKLEIIKKNEYLIGHMANVFKGVGPIAVIFLEIERRLSQDREGEANVAAIIEVVEQGHAKILPRGVFRR